MMGFSDIKNYCKNLLRKNKYGLTEDECAAAIQTTCDFFGIPVPVLIKDLTNDKSGQTLIRPKNPNTYYDDVLEYNLKELKTLGVSDYIGFSAIITHECAHRVFQNRTLPGPDSGRWEHELLADFFMGVRAGLQQMDITPIRSALACTSGSGTHPLGRFRDEYIGYGHLEGRRHLMNKLLPNTIEEYFQLFLAYRKNHFQDLHEAEMTIY